MTNSTIRIIIIDDHPVVLQGFTYMFQDMEELELVASFDNPAAATAYFSSNEPDVILLDINLPGMNGIEVCAAIKEKHPAISVIAISNIDEYSIIQRMLDAGASGYILKNASRRELVSCIRQVYRGEQGLSEGIRDILKKHQNKELPVITRREKEILGLLATGMNSTQIGEKIFISPLTVESHRRNLLNKFDVNNVAALIHKATEMKYI